MEWTLFFMFVVLKIPIAMLGYIVWYAVRATPEPDAASDSNDGGQRRKRPHPLPPRRPHPRRGPHGGLAPLPPRRVRTTVARARALDR